MFTFDIITQVRLPSCFINVLAKYYMVIVVYKFGVYSTSTRVRYQVPLYAVNSIRSIIPPFILE